MRGDCSSGLVVGRLVVGKLVVRNLVVVGRQVLVGKLELVGMTELVGHHKRVDLLGRRIRIHLLRHRRKRRYRRKVGLGLRIASLFNC